MERREFLRSAMLGGAAASRTHGAARPLAKRRYRDGVELSIVGLGGMVMVGLDQRDAADMVAHAFDRGVNYFDVAPTYGENGEAEKKLGPALGRYRQKVFLACKTTRRDAQGARAELEESLRRLRTDHFDLYQFHAVTTMKDVEQILGPGGAAEAFQKARQEGKVRYLGCSAHSEEAALAMMDRFQLDSILFPVNFVCVSQAGFGPKVLAHAKEKGVARLALKALAYTVWPKDSAQRKEHPNTWYEPIDNHELAARALRFTLSEDVTAAIPPGDQKIFRMALELAADFRPLAGGERADLLASAEGVAPIFPRA